MLDIMKEKERDADMRNGVEKNTMRRKIKYKIMSWPMNRKLILLCIALLLTCTLIFSLTVYIYTSNIIKQDTTRYVEEVTIQSEKYLNEKFLAILSKINLLQLDSDFADIISTLLAEGKLGSSDESKLAGKLGQMKSNNDWVESVAVFCNDQIYYNFNSSPIRKISFLDTDLYQSIENKKRIKWGINSTNELFNTNLEVIPVVVPLNDDTLDVEAGYIIVYLNSSSIRSHLNSIAENVKGNVFIYNEDMKCVLGDIITTDEVYADKILPNIKSISELEQHTDVSDYQLYHSGFSVNGWTLGILQSNDVILKDVRNLRQMMIGIAMSLILVFSIVAGLMSLTITKPLNKLKDMMRVAVTNDFSDQFHVKYNDEVGQLAAVFNDMCKRIKLLVQKVRVEQEEKRRAELRALNSQINPHFLYNTLDGIYWALMKRGDPATAEMVIDISNFFRLGLNKGEEVTTLSKELSHVRSYMNIQKNVYKDKFEYEIIGEEEFHDYRMIKVILQPLVENCILHGFADMRTGGHIAISIYSEEEKLFIKISDNGTGNAQDIMKHISRQGDQSFALRNINQRLSLHYGNQAKMLCGPNPGGTGIVITLVLPLNWEESGHV